MKTETKRTFENVKAILEAAGSSLDKVVKCNVYLRDINDFSAMNEVYATYFAAPFPALTTIQAGALPPTPGRPCSCPANPAPCTLEKSKKEFDSEKQKALLNYN